MSQIWIEADVESCETPPDNEVFGQSMESTHTSKVQSLLYVDSEHLFGEMAEATMRLQIFHGETQLADELKNLTGTDATYSIIRDESNVGNAQAQWVQVGDESDTAKQGVICGTPELIGTLNKVKFEVVAHSESRDEGEELKVNQVKKFYGCIV